MTERTVRSERAGVGARAWLVWWLGALSFAYAFFHRVTPSVMVADLMRDFAVGAGVLGNLSAIYFYAYAGLQIPIGAMLDRWGARRMLTAGACLAAAGAAIFAGAEQLWPAYLGRLMIGSGVAVGFVGTLKLVGHWFPPDRFAFLSGMTMLVAMGGGIAGQAPLAALVEEVGWRSTLWGAAAVGLALALATWLLVRDRPPGDRTPPPPRRGAAGLLADLRLVVASRQNWIIALYGGAMTAPMLSYAGLWGVPHMMRLYDIDRTTAAGSATLTLIGWAVGSPLGGWISDRIARRKLPMAASGALSLVCWWLLLYGPALPLLAAQALLFAAGAVSGAMVICIAAAREQAPAHVGATVAGFVNTSMVGGGALVQPLVGLILDRQWDGRLLAGARIYSLDAYAVALLALPLSAALAIIAALGIRETYCRTQPPA